MSATTRTAKALPHDRSRIASYCSSWHCTPRHSSSSGSSSTRPPSIARGLIAITTSRDTLLTDYFGIGGIGAGCVNAGLLTLCACFVYYKAGAKMTGAAVACLFLVLGFALFGKNLLNVWFIVIGRPAVRPVQGRTVRDARQHRVLRRGARADLLGDPVQHEHSARAQPAARGRHRASSSGSSWRPPRRSSSRRTWDSPCTTWDSPPASSARWWSRCTNRTASSRTRCSSGRPATTSCSDVPVRPVRLDDRRRVLARPGVPSAG